MTISLFPTQDEANCCINCDRPRSGGRDTCDVCAAELAGSQTKGIDVRLILSNAAERERLAGQGQANGANPFWREQNAKRLDEAGDALAALIEKATTALAFVGYDGSGAERVKKELREALARVGGAQ